MTRIALLVIVCAALGACATVRSPVPLGTAPEVLDPVTWEGTWGNQDGTLTVTVTDAAHGLARIDYEEDGERKELDLILRRSGDWIFVSVTEDDFDQSQGLDGEGEETPPPAPVYLWARVKLKSGAIIVWDPDAEAFAELVNNGVLPGTVEEDDVVLGTLGPEHYEIITSSSHGVILNWDEPLVLHRLEAASK